MKLQTRFLNTLLLALALPAAFASSSQELAHFGPNSAIDEILPFSDGMAAVKIKDKWGFINRDGKLIIPAQFNEAGAFINGLASIGTQDGDGYLNKDGSWKIPPRYQVAFSFGKQAALVEYPDQRWALIDRDGKDIYTFPPELDPYGDTEQGLLRVQRHYPLILRNIDGRSTTLPINTSIINWNSHLNDGLIAAGQLIREQHTTLYGYLTVEGKWIIPPHFDEAGKFTHGVAQVRQGETSGLINTRGEWVLKLGKDESLRRNGDKGMFTVMNSSGEITQLLSEDGHKLDDKLARCTVNGQMETPVDWILIGEAGCSRFKLLGSDGRQIDLPLRPTRIDYAKNHGLFLLKGFQPSPTTEIPLSAAELEQGEPLDTNDARDTRFVIINQQGKILIDSSSLQIKGKLSAVHLFGQPANATAQMRLPLGYFTDEAGVHILTPDGKVVSNPEWHDRSFFDFALYSEKKQGPLTVETERGWGAIDADGKWLIEPGFDELSSFQFGIAHVRQYKDEFLIDTAGKRYEYPEGRRFSVVAPDTLFGQNENGPLLYKLSTGKKTMLPDASSYGIAFRDGFAPINTEKGWGLIGTSGEWIVAPAYAQEPEPLYGKDGRLLGWSISKYEGEGRQQERRYGLLAPDGGKEVLKPIYSELKLDESGRLIGRLPHRYDAAFTPDGKELLRSGLEKLAELGDGWYATQKASELGYMNEAGKWVVEPLPIDGEGYFSDNFPFAKASIQGVAAFIDPQGRISTQDKPLPHTLPDTPDNWLPILNTEDMSTTYYGFDWQPRLHIEGSGENFTGGVALVERFNPDQFGLIDGKGKLNRKFQDDRLGLPKEGLAVIQQTIPAKARGRQDGKDKPGVRFGYVNTAGKPVIPARFEGAQQFSEGRAGVVVNGNIGIIDTKGKLIMHSGWQCGEPVLLDANRKVTWTAKPGCKEAVKALPPKEFQQQHCAMD